VRAATAADGDQDAEAQFYVLRKTVAPAVLGEVGFFTNINDARFLDSEQGQRRIARAYLDGIRPFIQD
jgi:N-acetylmuramoyl-L-alanine amidase